eukprot:TRINITY_DN16418_c0_g1_i1.p1 TRINITY_DN16418_c0_g1~~TRINITY_DN16418_c0_g1_i1.p1  ORF type:complete len:155 (-),score=14.68 TRINITY_DN16418_c0_g1_i1:13-477(-)
MQVTDFSAGSYRMYAHDTGLGNDLEDRVAFDSATGFNSWKTDVQSLEVEYRDIGIFTAQFLYEKDVLSFKQPEICNVAISDVTASDSLQQFYVDVENCGTTTGEFYLRLTCGDTSYNGDTLEVTHGSVSETLELEIVDVGFQCMRNFCTMYIQL